MPIRSLELRVYVHATEDRDKVMKALREILPEDVVGDVEVVEESYHGHYGNPITVITVRVRDPAKAERALDYIVSRLTKGDRAILAGSLEERVDKEGTLYFRLSKQDAYLGRLIVYEADDVVRVSVQYTGKRKEAMKEYARRLEDSQ